VRVGADPYSSGMRVALALLERVIVVAMAQHDQSLLEAALMGYEEQRRRIEAAIADLRGRLGGSKQPVKDSAPEAKPARKKRHISAEGRRRIAEAQRKRWAAQKKAA
jgi:hypothetical protein